MCRLVESRGWLLKRVKGSHHIYSKAGERKIISIPVHGNRYLKPGLANRIRRTPGSSNRLCGCYPFVSLICFHRILYRPVRGERGE